MRQLVEGGHISPRQKMPDAGTQSSSNVEMPPWRGGTNTPVCLPLLSESKRLLWVYSNQIVLPADLVAELDKTFDRFPYLTRKQNAALAQRCSLHPDQVKVWFMAQRLQYGISWDVKDIYDVRNKFRSNEKDAEENGEVQNKMDEEIQEDRRKKKNQKDKGGESGEKGRGENSPKEGRMIAQMMRAYEQLERNTKQEQPMKKEKPRKTEKDKPNNPKKRKRGTEMDKDRKKWANQDNGGEGAATVEMKMDESEKEGQVFIESEEAVLKRKEKAKEEQMLNQTETAKENTNPSSFHKPSTQTLNTVPLTENQTDPQHGVDTPSTISVTTPVNENCEGKPEALAGPQEDLHTKTAHVDIVVTEVGKQKELTTVDSSLVAADSPPTATRCKTRAQLAMMKVAFLHCQYPNSEQYTWLAGVTKMPRCVLVQWYGDMRYSLKRAKPRWMTKEQYEQVLNNIKHHQCLRLLGKSTEMTNIAYTTWMMMLEEGKRCEEKESEEASELKTESAVGP